MAKQKIQQYKGWRYKVLSRGGMLRVGGEDFINVTTVQQAEFTNEIEQRQVIENYAPNVGMIRRTMNIFNSQCGTPCRDDPWIEKSEAGFSLVQTLVESN